MQLFNELALLIAISYSDSILYSPDTRLYTVGIQVEFSDLI